MYLLDTTVVLEARRRQPDIAVASWLQKLPAEQLFISAATIGDLRGRIEGVRAQMPEGAENVSRWLDRLAATPAVLPMCARAFSRWAKLVHGGPPRSLLESMIAATAQTHGLTVASRNVTNFQALGVPAFNPYAI